MEHSCSALNMIVQAFATSSAACLIGGPLPAAAAASSLGALRHLSRLGFAVPETRSQLPALYQGAWTPPAALVRLQQPRHVCRQYATPARAVPDQQPVAPAAPADKEKVVQQSPAAAMAATAAIAGGPAAALALPPRVKGITRKLVMRQVGACVGAAAAQSTQPTNCNANHPRCPTSQLNRTIVRRLARRATIGIPIIGLFFVLRLLRRDAAALAAHYSAGRAGPASLYALAVAAELLDVGAQSVIAVGMGVSSGLVTLPAALAAALVAAVPVLPVVLAAADQVSLACAAASCGMGLAGDAWALAAYPDDAGSKCS